MRGSLAGVNLFPFRTILEQLSGRNEYLGVKDIFVNAVINFAGNICLFVPVGFLLPEISRRFRDIRNALAVLETGVSLQISRKKITRLNVRKKIQNFILGLVTTLTTCYNTVDC
ncbi:hypothetical protein B5E77_08200 [Lachnoclostridium sp. An131]|nr:hypothetical protein B5E77_08200 [Lachnoclostridium sp. An131]